jgi:hypothetical protein
MVTIAITAEALILLALISVWGCSTSETDPTFEKAFSAIAEQVNSRCDHHQR